MAFKFENLKVWHKALDYTVDVHEMSKTLAGDERFGLVSQINRASDSICLNIAEGSTGQSNKQFSSFLGYAIRSGIEVVGCLYILKHKKMIEENTFQRLYNGMEELQK